MMHEYHEYFSHFRDNHFNLGGSMKILTELWAMVAAYWTKNKFLSTKISQSIEIFPSRGVTFVKRTLKAHTGQNTDIGNRDYVPQSQNQPVAEIKAAVSVDQQTQAQANQQIEMPVAETTRQAMSSSGIVKPRHQLPEDSVLRRHYLAELAAAQSAITNPYPSDSVLRRHYAQKLAATLTIAAVANSEQGIGHSISTGATIVPLTKQSMPEDSVLKRHFLSQIQAEIESQCAPYPSDAVLKRHHLQLVQSKIQAHLAEQAA